MNHFTTHTMCVAALASIMLAGCASEPTSVAGQTSNRSASPVQVTAPAPAPVAVKESERTAADVPWDRVGPGWVVAMWSPVTPHHPGTPPVPGELTPETATQVLYLVSPTGERYPMAEFGPAEMATNVSDWSGDGSHVLLTPGYGQDGQAISLDLHTGERTAFPVTGTVRYTQPNGRAFLVSNSYSGAEPGTLTRIDAAGDVQMSYPTDDLGGAGQFSGDYLALPDGTQLVLSTANLGNEVVPRSDNSLVIVGNDGSINRTLPVPMSNATCAPVKWWTDEVLLAHCEIQHGGGEQLWTVPLDGGKPTALTAVNTHDDQPGFEGNYGNWNAFKTANGTFLPTAGACGTTFVSKLTADGHTERLHIPGVSDSAGLAGVSGDKLVVVGQVGCGGGNSLVSYDPATNTSDVLLGAPVNGGGVEDVRLYPVTP